MDAHCLALSRPVWRLDSYIPAPCPLMLHYALPAAILPAYPAFPTLSVFPATIPPTYHAFPRLIVLPAAIPSLYPAYPSLSVFPAALPPAYPAFQFSLLPYPQLTLPSLAFPSLSVFPAAFPPAYHAFPSLIVLPAANPLFILPPSAFQFSLPPCLLLTLPSPAFHFPVKQFSCLNCLISSHFSLTIFAFPCFVPCLPCLPHPSIAPSCKFPAFIVSFQLCSPLPSLLAHVFRCLFLYLYLYLSLTRQTSSYLSASPCLTPLFCISLVSCLFLTFLIFPWLFLS